MSTTLNQGSQLSLIRRIKALFRDSSKTNSPKRKKVKLSPESSGPLTLGISIDLASVDPGHDATPGVPSKNPTQQQPCTIAITGAGISDLALAIGLARCGIRCVVYEAGDTLSAAGAGIGLGSHSLAALDMLDPRLRGLYDLAKTGNENELYRNWIFDVLDAMPSLGAARTPPWTGVIVGAPGFERSSAHRRDLLSILESFIPQNTIRFGKRLEAVKQSEETTEINFEDDEKIDVDAVIGCDSVHGLTRKVVLGDTTLACVLPTYCHTYPYRGMIPMTQAKAILGDHGGDSKQFIARGRGVIVYPISRGWDANMVLYKTDPQP